MSHGKNTFFFRISRIKVVRTYSLIWVRIEKLPEPAYMGDHDTSGGWVGIVEKDSIRDGKRGISGIDIRRTVDLNFSDGSRNSSRRVSCPASRIGAKLPHFDISRAIRHKDDYHYSCQTAVANKPTFRLDSELAQEF